MPATWPAAGRAAATARHAPRAAVASARTAIVRCGVNECVALACRQAECEKLPGCEQSHALLARLAPKLRKTFQKHGGARL